GGKGQGFSKGFANLVFVGNTVHGGNQNNHQQADQADLGNMKRQPENQNNGGQHLNNQSHLLWFVAAGFFSIGKFFQYRQYRLRQFGAITKPAQFFQQYAG